MQPDERVKAIIRLLKEEYPEIKSALRFTDPMQLLVATILSAQCTDLRVNMVTVGLFKKYKSAEDYANADPSVFEQEIRSTGFYRNKAKNIIGAARMIVEKYGGRVPDTMEELIQLPGVARKTANIVLANAYGKIEGIAVDTHVKRLSKLLGLTTHSDPVKIERDLMKITPREEWSNLSHLLIFHGRSVCIARRPRHDNCVLNWLCPSAGREFYH
ncbi:MAG TPA: endonuclease III [Euryarchaeota archaeon]|nr:ultraviolet N-glycosylase/AP lyase [archaeon BMS3Bbin16]HDH28949.1 endonuclease III [Euryarchaeota archaeon]